jgi:hypothetical protein
LTDRVLRSGPLAFWLVCDAFGLDPITLSSSPGLLPAAMDFACIPVDTDVDVLAALSAGVLAALVCLQSLLPEAHTDPHLVFNNLLISRRD